MTATTIEQKTSPTSGNGRGVPGGKLAEAAPAQVQSWLASGQAVLIDVREPDEHAREWISGSRLIPLSRFNASDALTQASPGQIVVMHCRGGRRGADACQAVLASAGGRQIVNMTGGIEAWKSAGLPVSLNTAAPRLSVMRQVQLVIGLFVLVGAALTWLVHPAFVVIPAFFGAGLVFAGATGTCALATLVGKLPWNRVSVDSCSKGSCG